MTRKNETPAGKAGARSDLFANGSLNSPNSDKTTAQFPNAREAALALLCGSYRLTRKAGQFLGQLAVDPTPMSEAQGDWLAKLLDKNGLPDLAREGGQ